MRNQHSNIAAKTSQLVDKHSSAALLLAMLCLVFAVNFYFLGPGSDGGSGLGGTGKFGGESGLGGTGKGPDFGNGLKLGATDTENQDEEPLTLLSPEITELSKVMATVATPPVSDVYSNDFDVSSLRLSLENATDNHSVFIDTSSIDIATRIENIPLSPSASIDQYLSKETNEIAADALVSSLDILNQLMLAETQTSIDSELSTSNANMLATSDSTTRTRISVPIRPERPDRLNVPGRITPIQRVNLPTPPPVRPMRTLSTLLNR